MRHIIVLLFTILALASTETFSNELVICSGRNDGGTGYYSVAEDLSSLFNENSNKMLTNKETRGSADNIDQIKRDLCDFAIIQVDAAFSVEGKAQLNYSPSILNNIVDSLYLEPIHFLVHKDDRKKDIGKVLRGGKVHGFRAGSGHYSSATYLCSDKKGNLICPEPPVYEIGDSNFDNIELVEKIKQRLLDGDIDGIVYTAYAGNPIVTELVNTDGINLIDTDEFPFHEYDFYQRYTIKAGTYINSNRGKSQWDANTFATHAVLVSRENVDCREIRELQLYISELRRAANKRDENDRKDERKWISLLSGLSNQVIKVRECPNE